MDAGAPPVDPGPQQALAVRARPGRPTRRRYDVHGLGARFTEEAMGPRTGKPGEDLRTALALWLRARPGCRLGPRAQGWKKVAYGIGGSRDPWACTSCKCARSHACSANREHGFSIRGRWERGEYHLEVSRAGECLGVEVPLREDPGRSLPQGPLAAALEELRGAAGEARPSEAMMTPEQAAQRVAQLGGGGAASVSSSL